MPLSVTSRNGSLSALWALLLNAEPIGRAEALRLYSDLGVPLEALAEAARELRRRGKGATITYSPKVFLPLTNLCRDRCGYCTFRRDPGQEGARWMEREEILEIARAGEKLGCREALLSLGDRPEAVFPEARQWLSARGFDRTMEYLASISEMLLRETSLLPHSNPGLMARRDMEHLKQSNASLGLMLETTSRELFAPGRAHADAIDKWPARRLRSIRAAGELKIPFTTGILVGIGESPADVIDSLLAIRALHDRYGHIQEVIVQNFVPKPEIPMGQVPGPAAELFARTVAMARLILGPEMNLQAPPNLSPAYLDLLLDSGINDWGGISPLTVDFINPEAPWPQLARLAETTARKGLRLRERFAVYPEYVARREFFSEGVARALQGRADAEGYPASAVVMGRLTALA